MEGDLQQRILQTLKQAISWAEAKQNELLSEVLSIQKKINNLHDTKTRPTKKQIQQIAKDQIKEQNVAFQFQKKIDQLISKAEEQIQQIDNPTKKSKNNPINKNKAVETLPQIQKKPPIPTINRSKDPQILPQKPNYHYRNKNEVTGKITQTPLQKGVIKNSGSLAKRQEKPTIFQSAQKLKIQKIVKQQPINNNNKIKSPRKQINSMDNKDSKQTLQKVTYIDFSTFKIPINNLVQRNQQKNNKKVGTKKQIIQNLINQFNKNQMGYKNNESKAMNNFLNSFNKLVATRSSLPLTKGLIIQSRKRQAHFKTFNFQNLLESFQKLLTNNPISEQYNMNPKQAHRIKCYYKRINQVFENQIQSTREQLKLPPKLGIDFQMNTNQNQNQLSQDKNQQNSTNPYIAQFQNQLEQLLEQLKNLQNFDKESLKKLRVLISVGLYNGKHSPVIIQSDKYEEWRQYYQS